MEKAQLRRLELTELMADYLLEKGFREFTLRSLASAVGTSDRMLLHYFQDKQDLLHATLEAVTQRCFAQLEALQPKKMSQSQMLTFFSALIKQGQMQSFTHLWLELMVVAIREQEPYLTVASRISGAFLHWIETHLQTNKGTNVQTSAAFVLTFVEGTLLLNAVASEETAAKALRHVKSYV